MDPYTGELDLYAILGIPHSATATEIKDAYRRKVRSEHPDVGGSSEKFANINLAYDVLQDKSRRLMYDNYGMDGLCGSMAGNMGGSSVLGGDSPHSVVSGSFRRDDNRRNQRRISSRSQLKPGNKFSAELKVTLKELYRGTIKRVRIKHKVPCNACLNSIEDEFTRCGMCMGQGEIVSIVQTSPGQMVQQRKPCRKCNATGSIQKRTNCFQCNGTRQINEKRTLEVQIEPGMMHGQEIIPAGNVSFGLTINVRKHQEMKLIGKDLLIFRRITLLEALSGVCIYVKHLDGRILKVTTAKNRVINPGLAYKIPGQGMRYYRCKDANGNYKCGDLYVRFSIIFPEKNIENNMAPLPASIMRTEKSGQTYNGNVYNQAPLPNSISSNKAEKSCAGSVSEPSDKEMTSQPDEPETPSTNERWDRLKFLLKDIFSKQDGEGKISYTDGPASPNARVVVAVNEEERCRLFNAKERSTQTKVITDMNPNPAQEESKPCF